MCFLKVFLGFKTFFSVFRPKSVLKTKKKLVIFLKALLKVKKKTLEVFFFFFF